MKRTARIAWSPLVLVMLALFGNVSQALADAPTRVEYPVATQTLSGYCDFDVLVEPVSNKEKLTTFVDQAGNVRLLVTGALKVRVTNLETNLSETLNVSGPGRIVPQSDGSVQVTYLGSIIFWLPDPGDTSDLPPLAFVHGQIETEMKFDEEGNVLYIHVLGIKGHVEDVCTMLEGA